MGWSRSGLPSTESSRWELRQCPQRVAAECRARCTLGIPMNSSEVPVPNHPLPERAQLRRHQELIDAAVAAAADDDRILAAWLVGSLTTDRADVWSDIDFHVLVGEADSKAFLRGGWRDFIQSFTPTVMTRAFDFGFGGFAITPDWMHFDLAVHPGRPDIRAGSGFTPLLDRSGDAIPADAVLHTTVTGDPYYPAAVVDWFFYMLGNLAAVVGRNEAVLGTNGVISIRDTALVPLMYAEAGIVRTGGNKRLSPFLNGEQAAALSQLPPIAPTMESVVDGYAVVAAEFVRRGRSLADRLGERWPSELEEATSRHLQRSIGRAIPPANLRELD